MIQRTFQMLLQPVFAILLCACSHQFTQTEQQVSSDLRFDPAVVLKIRSRGRSLERLFSYSADHELVEAQALILNTPLKKGRDVLQQVRGDLDGSDYRAFLFDENYGYEPDQVAVVRSTEDFAYLSIVRTDGINYDVTHDQVLAKYIEWDSRFDLRLLGAGRDWLEASVTTPPKDWISFAREIYEFCPDVVDQGAGTIEALANSMQQSGSIYLWWD